MREFSYFSGNAPHSFGWRGRLLVALAMSVLSACGWRLQGTARLPEIMAVTYLDSADRYSDFNRALSESLASSGARMTSNRNEATAVVRIRKDESGQRMLPVSARNTLEEYEVFYTVEYSVDGRNGELIPLQTLELTRDYSYDKTAAQLAVEHAAHAQAVLREALARDLAGLVIRRVASL